jgi:phosphatidylethanolamine-binding protein (PEBP) family uncharacterized protein
LKDAMERAIGRLLRRVRAGERHLACNDPSFADAPASLRLSSAAFCDGGPMPTRFAGAGVGENLSPPLNWSGGAGVAFGRGSFGRVGYMGPRPVRGHGAHRYVFQLFALSRRIAVGERPDLAEVLAAMRGAVLARGKLVGLYERA